ncbi:MAG: PorV/PorQ family protein [Balneolales bacterium]|nr:PorV/PorQ family protein [Balneolales bacterium]
MFSNKSAVLLRKASLLLLVLLPLTMTVVQAQGILPSLGDSRSGTSGFQFLKINPDARSSAMGSSNVADANDASALYSNPALAAQMSGSQFYVGHTQYFVDISLNYASYVHRYRGLAFGGSIMYLDSGEMEETTEFQPFGTGRTFRAPHLAAGLTFAQELTNLFSYGITFKYLDFRVAEYKAQTAVFDVGFFYRVGDTGLRFAIGLSNFGLDSSPSGSLTRQSLDGERVERDFEDISPPTTFTIGAAYDVYSIGDFDFLATAQITNPSDNSEQLSIGTEVSYMKQFFFRTGYEFGVDEATLPSFGIGLKLPVLNYNLGLDYGFTNRDRLGSLHRFALKFNL